MRKKYCIIIGLLFSIFTYAQNGKGLSYGVTGGLQYNSAILPDVELNESINTIIAGDDVVKGVPQLADFKPNFKIGGFVKYEDGFGFTLLEANYTPTKIYKEFKVNTGTDLFPDFTYSKIDENYAYLDLGISYNIFLYKKMYFSLGAVPSLLLSNTGNINPQKLDLRISTGLGVTLNNKMNIGIRAELGINEVYKDSYIHHLMLPITVSFPF